MRRYGTLFVALGVLMGAEGKKDSGQAELKKFQGNWTVESYDTNGKKVPDETAKKWKLTVTDKNWALERGDQTNRGTLKLDPSKNPAQFEAARDGSGDAVLGIYEINGDTLTMCWGGPDNGRPTAFKGGEGKTLVIYKKAKTD